MTPEARATAKGRAAWLASEMDIAKVRRALRLSQKEPAATKAIDPSKRPGE